MKHLPGLEGLINHLPQGGIFIRNEFVLATKEVIQIAAMEHDKPYKSPACEADEEHGMVDDPVNHMQIDNVINAMKIDATAQIDAPLLLSLFQQPTA